VIIADTKFLLEGKIRMIGVIIEKGPAEWQILQQENGFKKIELSGRYVRLRKPEDDENYAETPRIYAMVSKEETGEPVIWWTECNIDGENWSVLLDIPAGGPYTITSSMTEMKNENWSEWGTRGDIISHVGVGDIYVIAGQSNSAGYGKDFIYDPPEMGVHIYKNNKSWTLATHPLQDSTGAVSNPNRDIANTGHSLYLSFAKYLKRDLGYPIGLVQTSQGGSALSAWNPEEDGILYRNMIERIEECGGKIKGVIWYQGCSETNKGEDSQSYIERFSLMRENLFRDLKCEDIPFIVFQISYCNDGKGSEGDSEWGMVREQQRRMNREFKNIYVIPTTDSSFSDLVHVSSLSNIRLGERAAKIVLRHLFDRNYMCDAPDIAYAKRIDERTVEISFDNVYERLVIRASGENLAIKAEDFKGVVNVLEYKVKDCNKMLLTFERSLEDESVLHGGYTKVITGILPVDFATHLPILSFYGVKIENI